MKKIISNLKTAATIGFISILPFALLELTFTTVTSTNIQGLVVLFGLLWLLSTAFLALMIPILQNIRAGNSLIARPVYLLLRIASSMLILTVWVGIVVDQLPCFLGVPHCD